MFKPQIKGCKPVTRGVINQVDLKMNLSKKKHLPHNIHDRLGNSRRVYRQVSIQVNTQGAVEGSPPDLVEEQVGHLPQLHPPVEAVVPRRYRVTAHQGFFQVPMVVAGR